VLGLVWAWGRGQGPAVNTDQAMLSSAVFACLRLLSEAVATLPIDTYDLGPDGHRTAVTRPPYLQFNPPQQSRINYLSQVMLSLLTDGNAYVLTPRDAQGVPTDLVVMDPGCVTVTWPRGSVAPHYKVRDQRVDEYDLMHIRGMCLPGALTGCSPITYARETIGLDLDARRFGSKFFENGALPGGVIETPGELSKEAAERFRDTWNASHQGGGNAHKIGVLTEGAKFSKVSIAPDDAQFIQTRAGQVADIARYYGVPPHLIADASNSTSWGSGLAEQNLAFGQFSLRSWVERIDEAHTRLLFTHDRPTRFVKLNIDAMLRASLADRYAAAAVGISSGFLTINEVRALEDLPPLPGGDGTGTENRMSVDALAAALQKIYLAVDKVITADEAREILNREGAGLSGAFERPPA
jgi:HK97 family phage portal protein